MAQGEVRIGVGVEGRRAVEQEFDRVDASVDGVKRSLRDLGEAGERSGRDFRDLADDTDRNMRRMSSDTDRTADQIDRDLRRMSGDLNRTGRDMRDLSSDADTAVGGIRSAFSGLDLSSLIGGALGGGLGAMAPELVGQLMSGIQDQLQQDVDRRVFASRIGIDPSELRDLEGTVSAQTGRRYERDAIQSALLAVDENLGGLAQSREDILTLTSGILLLEQQGLGDVSEIARAVANAGGAFDVDDPQRVLDLLAGSVQAGADRSRDLIDTLIEYSGNLSNLGLTIDDAFDIFVAGADPERGLFNLDKVADAIRELQVRVGEGTEEVDDALSEIGLMPTNIRQALARGGAEGRTAFSDIVQGIRDVDDEARQLQLGQAIFGTPFEDLGAGDDLLGALDLTTDALGNTTGALAEMDEVAGGGFLTGANRTLELMRNRLLGINDATSDFAARIRELEGDADARVREAYRSGDPEAIAAAEAAQADIPNTLVERFGLPGPAAPKPGDAPSTASGRDSWQAAPVHVTFNGITDTGQIVEGIDRTVQRARVFGG